MRPRLLADLDTLIYRAAFSVETKARTVMYKGERLGKFTSHADMRAFLQEKELWDRNRPAEGVEVTEKIAVKPEKDARIIAISLLDDLVGKFHRYEFVGYLSGERNFRYDLFPDYKANRINMVKPIHYQAVRSEIARYGGVDITDGIEADDAVCIGAWDCINNDIPYIVASPDKDLLQIPGVHYRMNEEAPVELDSWEADFNFYSQLLTGDTSDNIPGIKGLGPVKAAALLNECEDERDMYRVCLDQWQDEETMLLSANLLYLLRKPDDRYRSPLGEQE